MGRDAAADVDIFRHPVVAQLIRDAPRMTAVLDAECCYLASSASWAKNLGLTDESLRGRSFFDVLPSWSDGWRERFSSCLLAGAVAQGSGEALPGAPGDAKTVDWVVRPWHDADGRVAGLFLVLALVDRQAEVHLRRSNSRLREAQQLAQLGYWDWHLESNVVNWSGQVYELFGVDPSRRPLQYEDYFAAVTAEEREQVSEEVQRAVAGLGPFYFEHHIERPDGTRRYVGIHGRVDDKGDGGSKILYGAAQDLTERRELEDQLRQAQKMEAVGKLAGGVAHDFNNMLTAIFGFAEFAEESLAPDHPACEDIRGIRRVAEQAKLLTQQLLAFSRRQTVVPRVVDLSARVSIVERMLRHMLDERIQLESHLADDLWHVRIDPNAFEQVVVNLAVNARDAMPDGGQLTLETCNAGLSASETSARGRAIPPGEYVAFIISDNGAGMEESVRKQIFDPFFTTKGPGSGTGLGLSTCYGIIRQAGGYMWVYSELGRGTTFKIYLPRARGPLDATPAIPPATADGGSESVLVVEDNAAVRALATRVLKGLGYRVAVVESAEAALGLCRDAGFAVDLLLTDVVMTGINGKQLADRLQHQRSNLRVLYMSGYTENTIVHSGVLDQGVDLIQKPFSPRDLARRVRRALDL